MNKSLFSVTAILLCVFTTLSISTFYNTNNKNQKLNHTSKEAEKSQLPDNNALYFKNVQYDSSIIDTTCLNKQNNHIFDNTYSKGFVELDLEDFVIDRDIDVEKDEVTNLMLNSSNYYDFISGKMSIKFDNTNIYSVDFMFDSKSGEAYEKDVSMENSQSYYFFDEKLAVFDDINQNVSLTNTFAYDSKDVKKDISLFNPKYDSQNAELINRHYIDRKGDDNYFYDTTVMMTPFLRNCIMPQELIFGLLLDKSLWNIEGKVNYLNRNCYLIKGKTNTDYGKKINVDSFNIYVDKETGIWLRLEGLDSSKDFTFGIIADDINILSYDQALQYYETKNDSFISPLFEKKVSESSTYSGYDTLSSK